ncbi:MAG: hypothetical protein PHQ96_09395 [Candidatus Omnitrophica bacterium]|nr:hypothetical protein [Candidatus Omnitrophota bacterium]
MLTKKVIVFVLLLLICLPAFAYDQEKVETRQIITISGTVTKVDFVGNLIVVKAGTEEIPISVPPNTVLYRGTEKIGLADLEESDFVTIEYYISSPGRYEAVSIVDNNLGNE